MQYLVSIIVPVYNSESFLKECVNSILSQTYSNIECILVNDGSQDSSGEICDLLLETDERIKVIHKQNGGAASSRNRGIDVAKGDYIMFVDSDDLIDSLMVETLLNASLEYNSDIVGSRLSRFTEIPKIQDYDKNTVELFHSEDLINKLLAYNIDSSPCTKLYKSSLLNKVRFVEGRTNEDFLFLIQIYQEAQTIIYLNKSFYHYRYNPNSVTNRFGPHFYDQYYNMLDLEKSINNYPKSIQASFIYYKLMLTINVSFYTLINRARHSNYDIYSKCRDYLKSNWNTIFSKQVFSFKYLMKLIIVILVD